VDQGRRRVRIVGKGDRERIVPVDGAFFAGNCSAGFSNVIGAAT
jgi:hypothetical protein